MKQNARIGLCFMVALIAGFSVPGFAADAPFYKGKTLTVTINFAVGGPTDIEGRLAARHLAKHIPGQPLIIVTNMAGAGGVIATNYLAEVAKPDGLTMGYFTGQFFNILTADPTLRVDLSRFAYIASIEGVAVAYMRRDTPPGIKEARDIVNAQPFRAGGLSLNSAKDVRFRVQLDLLRVPFQYVTGYNSNSDARLALQRNEIQFFTEGTPAYRATVEPQMVKAGLVTPVYADEFVNPEGDLEQSPEVPDILSFSQLYRQSVGKPPSGVLWEALKVINMGHIMQRVAKLPPGSPPEAISALRQGFASMLKDPEFIKEFKKVTRSEPRYRVGLEADKLIRRMMEAPKDVKETIRRYTESK